MLMPDKAKRRPRSKAEISTWVFEPRFRTRKGRPVDHVTACFNVAPEALLKKRRNFLGEEEDAFHQFEAFTSVRISNC
jgi:hypothetical protein